MCVRFLGSRHCLTLRFAFLSCHIAASKLKTVRSRILSAHTRTHIRTLSVCFSSPSPIWFHFIRVALCWAVSRHFFFVCPFFSTEPVSKWCVCSCVKSFVSVNRTLGKRSTTVFHHPNYIRSMPGPGFAFRLFCPFAVPTFLFYCGAFSGFSDQRGYFLAQINFCLMRFDPILPKSTSGVPMVDDIVDVVFFTREKLGVLFSRCFQFLQTLIWLVCEKKKMQLIKQWACENAFSIMPWHLYRGSSWRMVGM